MPIVTFYQLNENSEQPEQDILLACSHLLLSAYSRKKWAAVLCVDQAQAEAVDEFVWAHPTDRFIPHNLVGEGPKQGTPAEISWEGKPLKTCHTLINLAQSMVERPQQYQHIIDFVPVDEAEKQQARERYKQYKQSGCNMQFMPLSQLHESNNG